MNDLTPELLDLMQYERVIEDGLRTFVDVGNALLAIRDGERFRAREYKTFEAYCRGYWGFVDSRARQLMAAAETVTVVTESGLPAPPNEGVARELMTLRSEPERMATVWAEAVERAPDGHAPTAAIVREVVRGAPVPPISKPDVNGEGISHPAQYSDELLPVFAEMLQAINAQHVLDPFAGTGIGLAELAEMVPEVELYGVEIEPEWANITRKLVKVGSALALPYDAATFDVILTSPCYGNRFADHHNASDPEARRSYTHDLGRELSRDSAGVMQWGNAYRAFHERAWDEALRVLTPDGWFILNIADHTRGKRRAPVTMWHVRWFYAHGFVLEDFAAPITRQLKQGTNSDERWSETVWLFKRKGTR